MNVRNLKYFNFFSVGKDGSRLLPFGKGLREVLPGPLKKFSRFYGNARVYINENTKRMLKTPTTRDPMKMVIQCEFNENGN